MNQPELVRWILIPLIAGLIGWLTNLIAVRMLFRPRRPLRLPGWTVQGLIPRRQAELAASIGHTVQQHLISHEDVRAVLELPQTRDSMRALLGERIGEFLDVRLKQLNPMVAMFLGGGMRQKLEGMLLDEVDSMMPAMAERLIDSVEEHLNFQQIVEEKIRQFDLDQLESIILGIARRELRAIEILGGVLGLLIGLGQAALMGL